MFQMIFNSSGYLVSIFKMLQKRLGFKYHYHTPTDDTFGTYINNSWNGLIGELVRKEIDIAVASISITE